MKKLIAVLLLSALAFAAKTRNWQDAWVIRSAPANNGTAAMPIGGMVIAVPLNSTLYRINTADLSIVINTERNLNVTFNKKTRIAIEGQKAYLIDDAGKEIKLHIVSKEALHPDNH